MRLAEVMNIEIEILQIDFQIWSFQRTFILFSLHIAYSENKNLGKVSFNFNLLVFTVTPGKK